MTGTAPVPPGDAGPGPILSPVTLTGRYVQLVPLEMAHLDMLLPIAADEELWRFVPTAASSRPALRSYIETALAERDSGVALPFVTTERESGRVVGSTRFAAYVRAHRRIEIGWTWVGREWQRTAVNTEAKLLMLGHAFEGLGMRRVELKTDALNEKSRNAIRRLGATEEGVFRQHMVTETGRVRDTVWFSILGSEWPDVKARLTAKLAERQAMLSIAQVQNTASSGDIEP